MMGRPVTKLCPSLAAYRRHLRHGERPCRGCAAVWATYQRARYAARKAGRRDDAPRPKSGGIVQV